MPTAALFSVLTAICENYNRLMTHRHRFDRLDSGSWKAQQVVSHCYLAYQKSCMTAVQLNLDRRSKVPATDRKLNCSLRIRRTHENWSLLLLAPNSDTREARRLLFSRVPGWHSLCNDYLRDGRIGVRITALARDFLFSKMLRPSLGPMQVHVQKGTAVLSAEWTGRGVKSVYIHLE